MRRPPRRPGREGTAGCRWGCPLCNETRSGQGHARRIFSRRGGGIDPMSKIDLLRPLWSTPTAAIILRWVGSASSVARRSTGPPQPRPQHSHGTTPPPRPQSAAGNKCAALSPFAWSAPSPLWGARRILHPLRYMWRTGAWPLGPPDVRRCMLYAAGAWRDPEW